MCITKEVKMYLNYCRGEKRLDCKTIKAYGIDLNQFQVFCDENGCMVIDDITKKQVREYLVRMQECYKDKTVKRKLATLKSFYNYLTYEEIVAQSPFEHLRITFKEKKILPKMVKKTQIKEILSCQYGMLEDSSMSEWKRRFLLRDVTIVELLFATGIRISELCSIKKEHIYIEEMSIYIMGKGSKERIIQIVNPEVRELLQRYMMEFSGEINKMGYLFVTKNGTAFSEQAARNMIKKYANICGISSRITPHMFRHAFATYLLEENVDIRYIQKMLGHSSISTTQIYCYVTMEKQRQILKEKHPRNFMVL